jgi:hypothetical protein
MRKARMRLVHQGVHAAMISRRRLSGLILASWAAIVMAPGVALAQENGLYTVSNVEVDVTGKDANAAKLKAISEAQVKAFRVLADRLGGQAAVEATSSLSAGEIGRLMSSLSIQSEKSGPGRYIGKLSISFLPAKIQELFATINVGIIENRAPRIVVLPIWNGPGGPSAWEDNPWRQAWLALNTENDLVPIIVPLGDLDDSQAITAEEAMRGDDVKLESLKIRYEAEAVLVAVGEPSGENGVHAVMSGSTPLGSFSFDKVYESKDGGLAKASNMAAQRFVAVINEKWKQMSAGATGEVVEPQSVLVNVPFSSLAQWNGIRSLLLSVQGVSGVDVTTLGGTGAQIKLGFVASFEELQQSLAVVGMKLVQMEGGWVLQPL